MLRSTYKRAKDADAAYSLMGWTWKAFEIAAPTAIGGVVIWAATYRDWFWNAYGMFGAIVAAVVVALLASIAFYVFGLAMRQWRPNGRRSASEVARDSARKAPYVDPEHTFPFLDRPKRELWKVQIRFARGGDRLRIRLDYSAHSGGIGAGFWSAPTQLFLREQSSFATGQDISIDLMTLDSSAPTRFWRWKVERNGQPLVSRSTYHCRLAFIIEDRVVDSFNFIVVTRSDDNDEPLLIGEDQFLFAHRWTKDDAKAE